MATFPSFTVVIPTLNEESYIGETLRSVLSQSVVPVQIIVVDANSIDKTKAIVKKFKQVELVNSQPGVGLQRNLGAEKSKFEWLVFLDADVKLPDEFFKKMFGAITKNNSDLSCPLYYANSNKISSQIFFGFLSWLFWLFQFFLPAGAGPAVFVKRSIFRKEKGFKNIKFEDLELVNRLAKKYSFQLVTTPIYISDRRLKKDGFWHSAVTYSLISFFFLIGQLTSPLAQKITYTFGKYKNVKS